MREEGGSVYLAGGCLVDVLLGEEPAVNEGGCSSRAVGVRPPL